jgi:succinate dehydrogenase / fumarate reductase iron-sulfur subunit
MNEQRVIFRIRRFRANQIDPPRFEDFEVPVARGMTVLDGLETIRLEQDGSLMYRHSCHHLSCGTCACKIAGKPRPACHTRLEDLGEKTIVLEPLDGFPCLGDLVVKMEFFHRNMQAGWSHVGFLALDGRNALPEAGERGDCFENCIECGACVSACPAFSAEPRFVGPAVLAAINRQMRKRPEDMPALMRLADGEYGQRLCSRALNCSRVCPTGVFPARHIAELRRMAEKSEADDR